MGKIGKTMKPEEKLASYKNGAELLGINFDDCKNKIVDKIKEEDGIDFGILLQETVPLTIDVAAKNQELPCTIEPIKIEDKEANFSEEHQSLKLNALLQKSTLQPNKSFAQIYINNYEKMYCKSQQHFVSTELTETWLETYNQKFISAKCLGIIFGYKYQNTSKNSNSANSAKYAYRILRALGVCKRIELSFINNGREYQVNIPTYGYEQYVQKDVRCVKKLLSLKWDKTFIHNLCKESINKVKY